MFKERMYQLRKRIADSNYYSRLPEKRDCVIHSSLLGLLESCAPLFLMQVKENHECRCTKRLSRDFSAPKEDKRET